ncbi:8-oxoguanine DNA glycosylase OGG fold protein [Micromonospora rubida]
MSGASATDHRDGAMLLPADASPFDAGVLDEGLRADEREWLVSRRRLSEGVLRDATDLVEAHQIWVEPANWAWLGDELGVVLGDQPLWVSRGQLTRIGRDCCEAGVWLPLLVACFAWGWGDRAIGPTRLSWVLNGNSRYAGLPRTEIENRLAAAVHHLVVSANRTRRTGMRCVGSGGDRVGRRTATRSIRRSGSSGGPSSVPSERRTRG